MKTADLVAGQRVDALIALAQDWEYIGRKGNKLKAAVWMAGEGRLIKVSGYLPSTNHAQWAELRLIFRVRTAPMYQDGDLIYWTAGTHACLWDATTLGLAICKAVIAAKWGDEIPDAIWEKVK